MREVLFPAGYVEVKTPLVFNKALWERSGHCRITARTCSSSNPKEADDGPEPMNCPGHFLPTRQRCAAIATCPFAIHEQTPLHRNEASGVLSGLTRVRQFSQDDAHCFVTQEQIGDEVERLIRRAASLRRLRSRLHGEAVDAARGVLGEIATGITPKRS